MKRIFFFSFSYLKYFFTSKDEHSLHSPFVFNLYLNEIKNKKEFYAFEVLKQTRNKLLNTHQTISINDLGAGSLVNKGKTRSVSDIVRNSGKRPAITQLLYKLTIRFRPSVIFDLGTSLGLTTLHFAFAAPKATIFTFEGCNETLKFARELFKENKAENIKTIEGNIDHTLPQQLENTQSLDLAFFDANHTYEATKRYFEVCLTKAHNDTLFIFDDIHWSEDMERAWKEIVADERVSVTIDLFEVGLVFFRKEQPKQHFILKL